jgi:hypothetical protein
MAERLARSVDDFALRMILHGMFPSRGWRIAVTERLEGATTVYTLHAVPPPDGMAPWR